MHRVAGKKALAKVSEALRMFLKEAEVECTLRQAADNQLQSVPGFSCKPLLTMPWGARLTGWRFPGLMVVGCLFRLKLGRTTG